MNLLDHQNWVIYMQMQNFFHTQLCKSRVSIEMQVYAALSALIGYGCVNMDFNLTVT